MKKKVIEKVVRQPLPAREVDAAELAATLEACEIRLLKGWQVKRPDTDSAWQIAAWENDERIWRTHLQNFCLAVKRQLSIKLNEIRMH